ncbi:HEXXH motif domain-containing protein [Phytohabitans houttuyneae]|uniref:HEXXH motif domain-containing protein n=1 Tax=Phytohabitans houttuyneae TaxID=1076126 RepID=A0A6V8K9G8_9ACTN|nr:HEXXH motif domain-containing protein [Phytohabitans houttuyneae]GFJ78656.1 HEXXH motif domain-containing protein [Phytohabitans houttuyneae]
MTAVHSLTQSMVDSLGAGYGDAEAIGRLRAGQVSKRLLLLRTLLDAAPSPRLDDYYALLVDAQRRSPGAVTDALAEPHVGAWLASSLRRLRGAWSGAHPIEADLAHLGAVAAAAAVRAGLEFTVDLLARDGWLMLPTLGRARVSGEGDVAVRHAGGRLTVGSVVAGAGTGWQELRVLHCKADELELRVRLDDIDPFRDCHRLSAAGRCGGAEVERWQHLLDEAWPMLTAHHRRYAEAIATGLVTLVPLHTERTNLGVNVTSMDAFGAVSLTRPADGVALAVGLLHEFQHAKLGALIDLVPLYERDDRPRYYAPWRDDPRPLGALLQGVYAFHGVTDFWRVQRRVLSGGRARYAQVEFVRWRDRVWRTLGVLEESDRFTAVGRHLLSRLRAVQRDWQAEPAPAGTVELAREAAEDHWVGWRLRNARPAPEAVARLADAWRSGLDCPVETVEIGVEPRPRALAQSVRLDLVQLRVLDPSRFAGLVSDPAGLASLVPNATPADLALAGGDLAAARDAYAAEVAADPDRLDAWIGLSLACQRQEPRLLDFPELCLAVHRHLRESGESPPDPIALARWLVPVRGTDGTAASR